MSDPSAPATPAAPVAEPPAPVDEKPAIPVGKVVRDDAAPPAAEPGAGGSAGAKIDAMICIPGVGDAPGKSFLAVAERVATAMERCAGSGRAVFTVATRDAKTRGGKKLESVAIRRHETPAGPPREVLHLYELDYRAVLDGGLRGRPPAWQAVAMAWTLAFSFPSLVVAYLGRRSKGWVQQLQVVYGAGIVAVMFLYLLLLVVGGGGAVRKVADGRQARPPAVAAYGTAPAAASAASAPRASVGPAPAGAPALRPLPPPEPSRLRRSWTAVKGWGGAAADRVSGWVLWLSGLVIVIPLAGAFTRFNVREVLNNAAPALASATRYVAAGQHRAEIVGELGEVLEHLAEAGPGGGAEYGRVHLAAYSFGSVVAIDALFQSEGEVSRRFRSIDTLVTIGCPYDFVRTYWPRYFQDRYAAPAADRPRWINVYCPLDVLGSNFIDEPPLSERRKYRAATPAEREPIRREWDARHHRGVELADGEEIRPLYDDNVPFGPGQGGTASFGAWLTFAGFRVHGMYWSTESAAAVNCFGPVVTRLFTGSHAAVLA